MGRGFRIISDGTDTHVMLVDVRGKKVTGKQAEELLGRAGMTVNRNTIPNDPASPFVTSGVRLGTPAMTTRGMGEPEMAVIAGLIDDVLSSPDDITIARIRHQVRDLTHGFPLYERRVPSAERRVPSSP
jgi:glycine hydroxymethyltransferase